MKLEIAEKWVEALRSGKFKQGKSRLAYRDNRRHQTKYCCLGVLCELAAQEGVIPKRTGTQDSPLSNTLYEYAEQSGFLPKAVQEWAEMASTEGHIGVTNGPDITLISLNDEHGMSFKEIAAVIETNADRL